MTRTCSWTACDTEVIGMFCRVHRHAEVEVEEGRPSATCPSSLRSPEPVPVSAHTGDGQAQGRGR